MTFAVIFDMDGVLVDSLPAVFTSFNEILAEQGIQFTEQDFLKYNGVKLSEGVKLWERDHGVKVDYASFKERSKRREFELIRKSHKENPSVTALLEELKKAGIPYALGTSSGTSRAEEMLEIIGYTKYFTTIVTGDMVKFSKPAPDLFLLAAKKLGVAPEHCIVIEDAPNGIRAAKAAGMKAIALKTRHHTREELREADLLIDSLGALASASLRELVESKDGTGFGV